MIRVLLPPRGTLNPNSSVDPLRYYYTPLLGRVFRARLENSLGLFERKFQKLLEIGYGSGVLMPTLASTTTELYGIDLLPEPEGLRATLARLGVTPNRLEQADVSVDKGLPFADHFFDGAVAFSILEHLKSKELSTALSELARVLAPKGQLLVGCPAVHAGMNLAFRAIGFRGIENHHFSSITDVLEASRPHFTLLKTVTTPRLFPRLLPLGLAPYTALLLERK